MRCGARIVAAVLIILLIGSVNALAVGYEPCPPAGRVESQAKGQDACGWWATMRKGLYVEKYPGLIDDAVSAVKDLLGQFGVLDTKTP